MEDPRFRAWVSESNDDALLYPDRDEAAIGIVKNWAAQCAHVVIYDWQRLFEAEFAETKKDNPEESEEEIYTMTMDHMDFNVTGGYVGPNTPLVLWRWPPDE